MQPDTMPREPDRDPSSKMDIGGSDHASFVDGVIILSPACHLLHMSPQAALLLKPLYSNPSQNGSRHIVPPALLDVGQEIRRELLDSLKEGRGLTSHVTGVLAFSKGQLFVRGLGLPDRYGENFLRILIISESPEMPPANEEDNHT